MTVETIDISTTSNITCRVTKYGKVCTVDVVSVTQQSEYAKWYQVGLIPEGYRPTANKNYVIIDNYASTSDKALMLLRVASTGVVSVWGYNNNNFIPVGTVTYISP